MKDVTAVLPVRNCREQLWKCLKALNAGTIVPEIIVVDDGSDDGTAQMVKKYWPGAVLLSIPAHTGYAHAANAGLRLVRTEYAFLIRPDFYPGKNCVGRLLEAMRPAGRGSAAGRKGKDLSGNFCAVPHFFSDKKESADQSKASSKGRNPGKTREILAVRDGCALYRMKALEEIGWFDERHFEGLEAFDLSLRGALYGYRTVEVSGAAVRSPASVSPEKAESSGTFHRQLAAGNAAYVFYKNLLPAQRILGFPVYALAELAQITSFVSRGETAEYKMARTRGRALCSLEMERRMALEEGVSVYAENLSDASFLGMDEEAERIYPLYLAEKEFFTSERLGRYLHIQRILTRDVRGLIRLAGQHRGAAGTSRN